MFPAKARGADAAYPPTKDTTLRRRTKKKLDTIAFTGTLLALGGILVWFFVTLPR